MGVSTSKEYKREWSRKRMKDSAYRALHRKRNRSMFAVLGWEVERAITTPKGQK